MIQVYNERLIIVTQKGMVTFSEIQKTHPNVKIVIQNFAIEHSIPNDIIETINKIESEYFLWVHFDVDLELGIQNVLIYRVYLAYDLIDDISINLDHIMTCEEKLLIAKKINLINYCAMCKYSSDSKALNCAVNPYFEVNDDNHCVHFEKR